MEIRCSVTLDNPDERSNLIRQLKALGVKYSIDGHKIIAVYIGYNKTKADNLLDLIEGYQRHKILYFQPPTPKRG